MNNEDKQVSAVDDVEAIFREMETRSEQESPGVLEVLRLYGGYEAAAQQAEAYFASFSVGPRVSSDNSTR